MHVSINKCILLGTIGRSGVAVSNDSRGMPKASFMLVVTEVGSDGREHQLWQPVEVWGKKAEALGELDPGAWVLVEGKLRRVKKGEGWETTVSGFEAQPLRTAPAVVA